MSTTCVQNAFRSFKGCKKGFKRPENQAKVVPICCPWLTQEWSPERSYPYHPMGNRSVELFNQTWGGMIHVMSPDAKADWPWRLQTLAFMYNCTAHETMGYPPLTFSRIPHLPVDVLFHNVRHDSAVKSYDFCSISHQWPERSHGHCPGPGYK